MRKSILCFILLLNAHLSAAQMSLHNKQWLIGTRNTPVTFATLPPQHGGIPESANYDYYFDTAVNGASLAVSDSTGELLFFIHYISTSLNTHVSNLKAKIFDKNGYPLPNGNLIINYNTGQSGVPLVVPYPKQEDKYILFYSNNDGLHYSVIDMTLNNGMGDVDPTQKDIMLSSPGTVSAIKMTSIPACESRVWLVVRSAFENAYYSFLVDENGVDPTKVISEVGHFGSVEYYISPYNSSLYGGHLTASHNGLYVAAGTGKGTEIYDFEKCSGQLKNARILDTTFSRGVIFSPDNSKLYTTTYASVFPEHGITIDRRYMIGEIYQFDFNAPNFEAIQNSKTIVMRNPTYAYHNGWYFEYVSGAFNQLKLGIDGKIYVAKNNETPRANICNLHFPYLGGNPIPMPPTFDCNFGQYLHVIHQPNALGMACEPELDYVKLHERNIPETWLQQDIKPANHLPIDTIEGHLYDMIVCFETQTTLLTPESVECPKWDDNSSALERTVQESGIYWVEYYNGCAYQRDSFDVTFVPLPQVYNQYFGCPEEIVLEINSSDSFEFVFTLFNEDGHQAGQQSGTGQIVFSGLKEGAYSIYIASNGCDTTLEVELLSYPLTEINVTPADTLIYYGDEIQLLASGAVHYLWSPASPLDSITTPHPIAKPIKDTWFTVYTIDKYGCTDSTGLMVYIDYTMPYFIPNAFTPNGDGLNDEFKIEGLKHQKLVQFSIYNRYGQEVFSTHNIDQGWDGTYLGQPCDMDVYYYVIELAKPNAENEVIKGDVSLIR